MDKLKAAIANSKQQLHGNGVGKKRAADGAPAAADGCAAVEQQSSVKRFRTKREIEEEKRQQQQQSQTTSTDSKQPPSSTATSASHTTSTSTTVSSASTTKAGSHLSSEHEPASFEVKRRLRSLSQPVTLFAETDTDRWQRLKAVELNREETSGGTEGRGRNTFHELLTSEVESELKQVLLEEIEQAKGRHHSHSHSNTHDPTTALATSSSSPSSAASPSPPLKRAHNDYSVTLSLSDFPSPHSYILYFFKRCLSEWEQQLDSRPTDVKRTLQGKVASATQKQTRSYLKPLFLLLKAQQIDTDILQHLLLIAQHCQQGRYGQAEEVYLRLAIGTAPWPMGVTMVGIHERSGREKIFSEHVAHVLNDETARKYIQSVKRCMSWCQQHYPLGLKGVGNGEEQKNGEKG